MSFRMRSTRMISTSGAGRLLFTLALAAALMAALATGASAKKVTEVKMVTQGTCPGPTELGSNTTCFHHIQEAVNEVKRKGTWVLIEPGVYNEEVKVKGKERDDLYIRGMDRNTVILDGTGLANPKGSNGIEIGETNGNKAELVDDVTVENLTVRNFEQEPSGPGGNAVWWSGGNESGEGRCPRLVGPLPDRLRHRAVRQLRDLHQQHDRRRMGTHLRLRLRRLGDVPRCVPGMPGADHLPGHGKQPARLLGLELRRQPDDRTLDLPSQLIRRGAERGKPR